MKKYIFTINLFKNLYKVTVKAKDATEAGKKLRKWLLSQVDIIDLKTEEIDIANDMMEILMPGKKI